MSQSVPVLMYHHVSPYPGLVTMPPARFEAQMTYLARAGFRTLTATAFHSFLRGAAPLPPKSVLVTFDDGFLDNYVHAYPILERLGLHAVIFAVTGWVSEGPPRVHAGEANAAQLPPLRNHKDCKAAVAAGRADDVMLRWSEIERMESSGVIEVHSHTHRHVRWDLEQTDATRRDRVVEEDLALSRQTLNSRLGKSSEHLCWPWGHWEPSYPELARRVGFQVLYTVRKGLNVAGGDAQHVARIVMKDQGGSWFARRMWIYRHSISARVYTWIRGA